MPTARQRPLRHQRPAWCMREPKEHSICSAEPLSYHVEVGHDSNGCQDPCPALCRLATPPFNPNPVPSATAL